jgi:DNA polymerase III alpha subunit (gram-positive type)
MTRQDDIFKFKIFIAFYDTESTDKKPTESDIISLGCVLSEIKDNKFINPKQFHTFVFSRKTINPIAQAIHNISQSDIRDAPPFPDAINLWKKWLLSNISENAVILLSGHNIFNFDDIILFCNFKQHRLDYDQFLIDVKIWGFLDTFQALKIWFKGKPNKEKPQNAATSKSSFALGHCFETFCGKKLVGAHNALTDSQACYDIFSSPCISKLFNLNSLTNLSRRKDKHVEVIKKTAGIAFQSIAERTQDEGLKEIDIPLDTIPLWDDDDEDMEEESIRLCLNCMLMFKQTEHSSCKLLTHKYVPQKKKFKT